MLTVISVLIILFVLSILVSINCIVNYNKKYNNIKERLDRYVDHYNEHCKKYNLLVGVVMTFCDGEKEKCESKPFEDKSLEELLKKAIKEENYEEAARLQNEINKK